MFSYNNNYYTTSASIGGKERDLLHGQLLVFPTTFTLIQVQIHGLKRLTDATTNYTVL